MIGYLITATVGACWLIMSAFMYHDHLTREPLTIRVPPGGDKRILGNTEAFFTSLFWPIVTLMILFWIALAMLLRRGEA